MTTLNGSCHVWCSVRLLWLTGNEASSNLIKNKSEGRTGDLVWTFRAGNMRPFWFWLLALKPTEPSNPQTYWSASGPTVPGSQSLQKLHEVLKKESHLKTGERPDQPHHDLSQLDSNYLWIVLFRETWNTFYRRSMFGAVWKATCGTTSSCRTHLSKPNVPKSSPSLSYYYSTLSA